MAIWQFDFEIISKQKVTKNPRVSLGSDEKVDYSWHGIQIEIDLKSELNKILPSGKSWSENMTIFGLEDGTCVKLFHENNKILEIAVRIDLREDSIVPLSKIITVAHHLDSMIYSIASEKIFNPSVKTVLNDIYNSPAKKFVYSPDEFFSQLNEDECD